MANLTSTTAGEIRAEPVEHARIFRPVCQRTTAEEEAWWAAVAAERGLTLAEFDARCGVVVEPERDTK